jgi:hypothetical protein
VCTQYEISPLCKSSTPSRDISKSLDLPYAYYSYRLHIYIRPNDIASQFTVSEIGPIDFNSDHKGSSRKHIFISWTIWNLRLCETWGSVVASNSRFRRGHQSFCRIFMPDFRKILPPKLKPSNTSTTGATLVERARNVKISSPSYSPYTVNLNHLDRTVSSHHSYQQSIIIKCFTQIQIIRWCYSHHKFATCFCSSCHHQEHIALQTAAIYIRDLRSSGMLRNLDW